MQEIGISRTSCLGSYTGVSRDSQRGYLNSQHWSGRTASRQQIHGLQTPKIRTCVPRELPTMDGKLLTSSIHVGFGTPSWW